MTDILDNGFEAIKDLFFNVNFFGFEWALSVIITLVVLLLISRNPQDWKQLTLPIITLFGVMGFVVSPLIYVVAGMMFVFGMFNTRELGNLITTGNKTLTLDNIKLSSDELKIKNYSKILDNKELFRVAMDRNKGYKARKEADDKEKRDKMLDFNRERKKTEHDIAKIKDAYAQKRESRYNKQQDKRMKEYQERELAKQKLYDKNWERQEKTYQSRKKDYEAQQDKKMKEYQERELAKQKLYEKNWERQEKTYQRRKKDYKAQQNKQRRAYEKSMNKNLVKQTRSKMKVWDKEKKRLDYKNGYVSDDISNLLNDTFKKPKKQEKVEYIDLSK